MVNNLVLGGLMDHIRNVLRGMGAVINPLGFRRPYLKSQNGGFRKDFANLAGDWNRVGDDLETNSEIALLKYGESANYSTSKIR